MRKKHLLIIGARGWGREIYASIINSSEYKMGKIDIKGFLDSDSKAFEGLRGVYPPIISSPEEYKIQKDDIFFVALGEPSWRKHYAEMFEAKGAHFHTIVCDGAYINPTAKIGEGSFIAAWTTVSDNVTIGKHVMIHGFSTIGHNAMIDDYASLEAYVFIGGLSKIGKESVMHIRSSLTRNKSIGSQVEVGANSVVMRNAEDGIHLFGNPAKKIEF